MQHEVGRPAVVRFSSAKTCYLLLFFWPVQNEVGRSEIGGRPGCDLPRKGVDPPHVRRLQRKPRGRERPAGGGLQGEPALKSHR